MQRQGVAAFNLASSLDHAGWKIPRFAPVVGIKDGVEVQPFFSDDPSVVGAAMYSNGVADALVDFLHSYNWQAARGFLLNERGALIRDPKVVPPDGLRIRIGLYPAVSFVTPPGDKAWAEAIGQIDQQMHESEQEEKQSKERATGPCQTLGSAPGEGFSYTQGPKP